MQTPDLSNLSTLPPVAAVGVGVGSPDAKRPRPEEEEESDPFSSFAPTSGRWWPVDKGEFRIMMAKGNPTFPKVMSFFANPTTHYLNNSSKIRKMAEVHSHLWFPATLIEERSLGAGQPVAAIFLATPNIPGYPKQIKDGQSDEMRKLLMDRGAYGANKTSLPPTRAPDEIHLIVNLLNPNQCIGGWDIMAIGIVPVPVDDEEAQRERLGDLMANCPFVDVDVVKGE